ncbi:DUF4255 domain-containing protein [Undibacterium cyanobacteriorum]|uniref:DUF4255 domain-containing protein n=1 Tax=Undibacterium cyanobacteriorum TaxID=3073561 RepID=A0ABY9RKD1_9BURK|nr:DUF4255 domain-containing protein [Undibacterium sp. 20NA77.5]WMW80501.1 DUF4255 domain-containing protein [Undibacterium sp. 20NA77.5]
MINAAISHLANQLNQQFRNNFHLMEDVAVVSNLVELDGTPAPNANNKLVLTLVNIEKDTMPHRPGNGRRSVADAFLVQSSPLYLNLYVMLSANFGADNYPGALRTLSQAISFFQQQAVFDRQNSPGLDSRIDKLILDMENLKIPDLNNLWSLMGGKYLPSAFYKVRMITVDSRAVVGQAPMITAPERGLGR